MMGGMSAPDWSTPEGLAAIKRGLASRIAGWQDPVAYGRGPLVREQLT
jgi:hypothetical protein